MSKLDSKKIPKGRRDQLMSEILMTFGSLGLSEEGKLLLRGILKESEIVMLARRIQIAKRLLLGQQFQKISLELRVGLETIRHVHEWLEGRFDDYRSFLLLHAERSGKKLHELLQELDHTAFDAVRQRYPTNYVLLQTLITQSLATSLNE